MESPSADEIKLSNRSCPTCLENKSQKFIESKVNPMNLDFNSLGKLFIGFRKDQCFFDYYKCSNCFTLFCKEYFDQNQLDILYSKMPDNKAGLGDKAAFKTQLGYAKIISKKITKSSPIKILEVGPDLGLLSLAVSKLINVDKIVFIEPNLEVHNSLIETFKNSKIDVIVHEQMTQLDDREKFDLIVGIHVLDHLINPFIQLEIYKKLLSKNGKIAFVTHDFNSFLAKIMKKKWPPFCLQHPQLYSFKSFKRLATFSELNFIGSKKTTNWLDLNGILLRIFGIFGKTPKFVGLNNLVIPVRLGNIVSIFDQEK
jgi:hypothetical protein